VAHPVCRFVREVRKPVPANAGRSVRGAPSQQVAKALRRTRARHALVAILSVVAAFLNVINDMVQMHEIFVASIAVRSHELEA